VDVTPPFIVSAPPECSFHRTLDDATAAWGPDAVLYDAHGVLLMRGRAGVVAQSVEPEELAHLLRRWLSHADALRESTASWPLWLLVHAAVDHCGYAG
jgi:hypothetical protein